MSHVRSWFASLYACVETTIEIVDDADSPIQKVWPECNRLNPLTFQPLETNIHQTYLRACGKCFPNLYAMRFAFDPRQSASTRRDGHLGKFLGTLMEQERDLMRRVQ